MPIRSFRELPKNLVEWGKFFQSIEVIPNNGTVTNVSISDREPLSVMGRAAAFDGPPADIIASANGLYLGRRGNLLAFQQVKNTEVFTDRTAAEIAASVTPVNYWFPELNVLRYGAVGDDSTDCLPAFNSAWAVAVAKSAAGHGAEIVIPEGEYRLSDEWNVWRINSPRRDITIRGADQLNTLLIATFYGAGKALIKCVSPTEASRSSPISIRDIGFRNVSTTVGVNPAFIEILGHGESRLERLRCGGNNNTAMRLYGEQNLRADDIVIFNSGRNFSYKNTVGLTFDAVSATKTITASGSIFDAGDIGKYFFIFPAPDNRIRYHISAVNSPTEAEYDDANGRDETGAAGHFEPARCSIADDSTTLVANASCFTADMVGMVLYVRAGRTGAFGKGLLRAEIASYTDPTTVELDTAATEAVVDEFFGVAVLDMGKHPLHPGSSDVKISKLHIESFSGVAFVAQNTDSYHITGSKIHGVATVTDTAKALSACWLDDYQGRFEVDFDTTCSMSDTRLYICNQNDLITFDHCVTRSIKNGTILTTEPFTDPSGYVEICGLNVYQATKAPEFFIVDGNYNADPEDARVILSGVVNTVGDLQSSRIYSGRNFFRPQGGFAIADGVDVPSAVVGYALVYVDNADGDLKVKFGDGTIKTIVTDT